MLKFETIVAPVTPSINSPVGIVRVSGPLSKSLALKICGLDLVPRFATYCPFKTIQGDDFDMGIAIFFKGPNSFTGEDVVEFQCHGGLGVVDLLVKTCLEYKANDGKTRLAEPGEYSKRAYLNDRIDLIEAEAIADMINASTANEVKVINKSLSGNFGVILKEISERILSVRAELEARIDFVEDNLGNIEINLLKKNIDFINSQIANCIDFSKNGKDLLATGKVALIGPSNVGKSSLLNYFSMKDSAIVSNAEGTTRDVIREIVKIENHTKLQFSDTAGIRNSFEEVEKEGIKRSWMEIEKANCLLFICDASSKSLKEELELRDKVSKFVDKKGKTLITVFNKIDKIGSNDFVNELSNQGFTTSVKTGKGLCELKNELRKIFTKKNFGNSLDCLIVSERIELNLKDSEKHILEAIKKIKFKQFDLCAEDLKQAHSSIKKIIGFDNSDDLLDKIFSSFCIGK